MFIYMQITWPDYLCINCYTDYFNEVSTYFLTSNIIYLNLPITNFLSQYSRLPSYLIFYNLILMPRRSYPLSTISIIIIPKHRNRHVKNLLKTITLSQPFTKIIHNKVMHNNPKYCQQEVSFERVFRKNTYIFYKLPIPILFMLIQLSRQAAKQLMNP